MARRRDRAPTGAPGAERSSRRLYACRRVLAGAYAHDEVVGLSSRGTARERSGRRLTSLVDRTTTTDDGRSSMAKRTKSDKRQEDDRLDDVRLALEEFDQRAPLGT